LRLESRLALPSFFLFFSWYCQQEEGAQSIPGSLPFLAMFGGNMVNFSNHRAHFCRMSLLLLLLR